MALAFNMSKHFLDSLKRSAQIQKVHPRVLLNKALEDYAKSMKVDKKDIKVFYEGKSFTEEDLK